jgi:UDP-N-acetylmuramoyl-L-alanyl-D-glutamate--2,6-diaminopimelate ligase
MMAAAIAAMSLGELLGSAAGAYADIAVTDLTIDSRQVSSGAAFVALPGQRGHGLAFADRALGLGAAIVLYEPSVEYADVPEPSLAIPVLTSRIGELAAKFFARNAQLPDVIGVTGTNGKTTVAYLTAQALTALGRDCGYIGTLGYGRPQSLVEHQLTTPDCFTLHRELATLASDVAALEVSSHALAQDRIAGLPIYCAAVTNLSRDHLDAHGSMENYAETKTRLVRLPSVRSVVLNYDDEFAAALTTKVSPGVRVIGATLRAAHGAEIHARATLRGLAGTDLEVSHRGSRASLRSRLVGDFNAENLLLSVGLVTAAGYDLAAACHALSQCKAAPGRMEVFGGELGPYVVVDYAHTPAALDRALATLTELEPGSITCVFGCGGERDQGKRPMMGRAAQAADRIVLTDDNPRGEDPASIIADIRRGIDPDSVVTVEHDRVRAIEQAIERASRGDIVLIAGKGHETTQTIGRETRPLDDRAIVVAAIGAVV